MKNETRKNYFDLADNYLEGTFSSVVIAFEQKDSRSFPISEQLVFIRVPSNGGKCKITAVGFAEIKSPCGFSGH